MASRFFPNLYSDTGFNLDQGSPDQDVQDPYPADVCLKKARDLAKTIEEQIPKLIKSRDVGGGLYTGAAGIAYAFWYLQSKFGESDQLLVPARTLLHAEIQDLAKKREYPGFLIGHCGVYAVASVLAEKEEERELYLRNFASASQLVIAGVSGADEVLVGRAGYLYGCLWLQSQIPVQNQELLLPDATIQEICHQILQSGIEYSKSKKSPSPLMYQYHGTEYIGAAHGLCAILQILLSFMKKNQDVRSSIDFLLSIQNKEGNFPCAMDEVPEFGGVKRPEPHDLVHWCHGAPGVIYLMAKAYLVYQDEKYLKSALKCGDCIWEKGLLKKGPGICHGVAGNGYAFLLLYRITKNKMHLYRAKCFAHFMNTQEFISHAKTPDSPYSLYEGLAGTMCFLADLSKPDTATFPFFDVFES